MWKEYYLSSFTNFLSYRPVSDVTSDLTIDVGSASFSLHKVSKFKLIGSKKKKKLLTQ